LFLKCVDLTQRSQYLCFGIKNKNPFWQKQLVIQKKSKLKPICGIGFHKEKDCFLNQVQSQSYHNLLIFPIKK